MDAHLPRRSGSMRLYFEKCVKRGVYPKPPNSICSLVGCLACHQCEFARVLLVVQEFESRGSNLTAKEGQPAKPLDHRLEFYPGYCRRDQLGRYVLLRQDFG